VRPTFGFIQANAAQEVGGEQADLAERVMEQVRAELRPEFINRIDEIVVFHRLDPAELRDITDLMLENTRRRLHAQQVAVEFTPDAIDWIVDHGYEPAFGARPMRRTIQREVETVLSEMLLDGRLSPGEQVYVDASEGDLIFDIHEEQHQHAGA
jgi:ATP-dependent Clp protease ATP-binding subunit ClpC